MRRYNSSINLQNLFDVIEGSVPFNSCFYSSFLFMTNIFAGWYYVEPVYTSLFTFLFMASILYHATYIRLVYLVDQLACGSVVGYTLYTWTQLLPSSAYEVQLSLAYISCLSYVILSYYCGQKFKKFSHHPNKTVGNYYHSLLHLAASVGCHSVLYLKFLKDLQV